MKNSMRSFTVEQIAAFVQGTLEGDKTRVISGINKIEDAQPHEITFLANPKYKSMVYKSNAGAILVRKDEQFTEPVNATLIRVEDPYYTFVKLLETFIPRKENLPREISDQAFIDPTAKIGNNVAIAPFAYIGPGVKVGDHSTIYPGVVLLRDVSIGENCILYPNVTVREECEIGNNVIIHNNAVIGSDGFGFAFFNDHYKKIPQLGKVVIEDDVEIGANCTIDRATLGETRIKKGTKLDNLVHIAHNVEVGMHTVMAAQTGISGSTRVGNYVMIGGQVGVVGHIKIGDKVQIGAQSGVSKNIKDGQIVFGSPARPIYKAKKIEAVINNLPEMYQEFKNMKKNISSEIIESILDRLKKLEKDVEEIGKKM